ncbi:hypothetical protein [Roseomonas chloroacetimidivorans]|uniref:hypothetical protein n=1 Tax=Roseomonas chloroacetimidivorans TaxID=1766656 RepID=UPI003C79422E
MKTIRELARGKLLLRLVQEKAAYSGVVIGGAGRPAVIRGIDPDEVWQRLQNEAGRADRSYFGFDRARQRFLRFFPGGFTSKDYVESERNYKVKAKVELDAAAPLEAAATGEGYGEAVLRAFRATNLLAPIEKTKLQSVLRGASADAFVQAAARFTLGAGTSALMDMDRILRPHDSAKWTVVTYLPFLWRPSVHMFLKPEVTKGFATKVGHPFVHDYETRLHADVYDGLLSLVGQTESELVELRPKDRIDVQSFLWVVGAYDEAKDGAVA